MEMKPSPTTFPQIQVAAPYTDHRLYIRVPSQRVSLAVPNSIPLKITTRSDVSH
jgi:hypothetical protein